MIDLPLTGWVAMGFLGLIYMDSFKNKGWSAYTGFMVACGVLTKWSFVVFMGVPVLIEVYKGFKNNRYLNIGVFASVVLLLAGPWYIKNFIPAFMKILYLSSLNVGVDPDVMSWDGWTWYIKGMVTNQVLWPLFVMFIIGLVMFYKNKKWAVLGWVVIPFVVFSLLQNKDLRYTLPFVPAVALISVGWLSERQKMQKFLMLLLAIFALFQYTVTNYAGNVYIPFKAFGEKLSVFMVLPPKREDWNYDAMFKYIEQNRDKRDAITLVTVIANHPYMNSVGLRVSSELAGYQHIKFKGYRRNLGEFAEFILTKTGNLGPEYTLGRITQAKRILDNPSGWFSGSFKVVLELPLPDGTNAVLYQRLQDPKRMLVSLKDFELELKEFEGYGIFAKGIKLARAAGARKKASFGEFDSLKISAESVIYKEVLLEDINIAATQIELNLHKYFEERKIQIFRVSELRVSAKIKKESLEKVLIKKAKWLKNPEVEIEGGK